MQINKELKELIPALKPEEFEQLEKSCIQDGIRDAIVLWNDTIIDGHNRYEIATKHGLKFETISKEFDSLDSVKLWMIDNQKGRRNLTDWQLFKLIETKKQILLNVGKNKRKETLLQGDEIPVLSTMDKSEEHNTQKLIAEDLGWSSGKTARADYVMKHAPEDIKKKLENNDISIHGAYKEIKTAQAKEERAKDIEKQKEKISKMQFEQTNKKYASIVLDPPWMYGREYDPNSSRVANPYPEMSQADLMKLEIPAMDDSVMFLWTTHKFIFDAKELMEHWGFDYKATLVWNKEKIGMGHWFRMQCEFCLFGIKGNPIWDNTTLRDIITEPRREHSRKPELFYDMVEAVSVGEIYEFFARTERDRFVSYGNETNKFNHELAE